jgi:hypothetical protein
MKQNQNLDNGIHPQIAQIYADFKKQKNRILIKSVESA